MVGQGEVCCGEGEWSDRRVLVALSTGCRAADFVLRPHVPEVRRPGVERVHQVTPLRAASGILTTAQQIGIALGTALLGTVFFAVADPARSDPRWGTATAAVLGVEAVLALSAATLGVHLLDHIDAQSGTEESASRVRIGGRSGAISCR